MEQTCKPLIHNKTASILMVGCGNAPLSSHMHDSGYTNLTNTDYCDVVIKQQRERFPHMQWEVMDALNMDYPDGTFDYVFDKSLIDTLMCYSSDEKEDMGAAEKTQMLFKEMHRVLKPGGRLIQISLHKEHEVIPFRDSPSCDFAATTCKLVNIVLFEPCKSRKDMKDIAIYHTFAVFDKLEGVIPQERTRLESLHPLQLVNALSEDSVEELTKIVCSETEWDPRTISWKHCTRPDDLIDVFNAVFDDISGTLRRVNARSEATAKALYCLPT